MCGPYGWGKFDDGKNMGTALAGAQTEFFRCYVYPSDLNIDPADENAFTFIGDGQNSLAAAFNFRGIIDLSKIQNIRLNFQPGLGSID